MSESNRVNLALGGLKASLSLHGGAILSCTWRGIPILRTAPEGCGPGDRACFPLLPFGNRITGNGFRFEGRSFSLTPNTPHDPHYLHGEGWQSDWQMTKNTPDTVEMRHACVGSTIPYAYQATQSISVAEEDLSLTLSVTNVGPLRMPFGIGFHPYFPLTRNTVLQFLAGPMMDELPGHLSGPPVPTPADMDFRTGAPLPGRWINNAFENWDGDAWIKWLDRGIAVHVQADAVFRVAQLYAPGSTEGPSTDADYFAFEPMSHLPNGHNLEDLGGLVPLAKGETLTASLVLRPQVL
ncbi:aldose 1-epimerase [Gymnodinialimonas ulvae]|uniref:aldose 1-epimerase n=1 Tax=Gymnodinialimonas ulvae TaxID=3126504 RepID=UPI0030B3DDC0